MRCTYPVCPIQLPLIASAGPKSAPSEAPLDEARTWLHQLHLLNPGMAPAAQLRRHLALSGGEFGEDVTPAQRSSFLTALLPVEDHIAAYQDDIGCLTDPAYHYKLDIQHLTPIQQPPIKLQPAQEEWLNTYLDGLEAKGVISRILPHEQTPIVTAVFLVEQGQSGQPYRLVQNIVPVNKRTNEYQHMMTKTRRVQAHFKRYKYASMLDLKAGYLNVPFDE